MQPKKSRGRGHWNWDMGIVRSTHLVLAMATLTPRRDVADKFPEAEVIGRPPSIHFTSVCIDMSAQESISPQPSGRLLPKIFASRSTTAAANGSTLQITSTTSTCGCSTLALPTGPPSTKNALGETALLKSRLGPLS